MSREFTIDELDALTTGPTPGPWCVDRYDVVPVRAASEGWRIADCGTADSPDSADANARLIAAAPDLAAFARQLLTERDTLRATVDRLRSVVEALAEGCREAAASDAKEDPEGAAQELFDSLSSALGLGFDAADFLDIERALRARLAAGFDVAEVPDVG